MSKEVKKRLKMVKRCQRKSKDDKRGQRPTRCQMSHRPIFRADVEDSALLVCTATQHLRIQTTDLLRLILKHLRTRLTQKKTSKTLLFMQTKSMIIMWDVVAQWQRCRLVILICG